MRLKTVEIIEKGHRDPITPSLHRIIFNISQMCTCTAQACTKLTNPSLEHSAPPTPSRPSDKRLSLAEPPQSRVPPQASCSRSSLSNPSQCNSIHPFTSSPSPSSSTIAPFKSISNQCKAKGTNSFSHLLCSNSFHIAR